MRCLVVCLLPLLAQAQADFLVDRSTLPNGIDLLLHVDHKAPIVRVNVRIHAGSKHEKPGQYGIAHLTEHLFYQSRDGVPFTTMLERLGATNGCGDLNEDFTEYCETVPASRLERLLWMVSNRFALFLSENLTQKHLDSQREVVMNERRQKVENEPYHRIHPVLHEQAFPPGHPYNHEAVGEYADLRSMTLDDIRAFYAAHYTSDQLTIAITGDFDPAETKRWVAKYFGPLAPADVLALPPRSAPPLTSSKFVRLAERVNEERVFFAWVGPPAPSRDAAALEFVAFMLSDDYSPRNLYKALSDRLAQGVSVSNDQFQDASVFYPVVTAAKGASISAIDEKVVSELARLGREGPTAAEMARTRDHLDSDHLSDLESIAGMASTMQQVHDFYGGIDRWREWTGRYTAVTAEDVRAAVNRWLLAPHLTIDVVPVTAVHPDTDAVNRTTPPPFQAEKPFRPPEVQSAKLANGLQVLLLERHDVPKVAMRIQFRAGALLNPRENPAVMLLAAAAAGKDNKTAGGIDVEQALSDLGAGLYGDADLNGQDFGFSVLRKNLDAAFRMATNAFLHPVYPEWNIEARKKDWLREMEHPETSLDNFARELFAAAFGSEHPLGRGLGTADSLRAVTVADVRSFHERYWKPDSAALIFAGDITLKEAVSLATETLGGWTGTAPPAPPMAAPAPKHGRIVYVDRKGVTQTMIVQVLPGIPRDHPDYPALYLADRIYGGMASNRIWENIRGQHSIAYYARSELSTLPGAGMWTVVSPVQQDSTALAMREFDKELAAFGRSKPVTQAELDQARDGVLRSLPEQFEDLGSAVGTIAWNWAQGLPISDLQAFPTRLSAVKVDEVNAVARKYARPEQAFFLLVGDREKIEPQLRDFR